MKVKLVKLMSGYYSIRPADPNDTTILMVGVASWSSVRNTCKKNGWKVVGTVDRTKKENMLMETTTFTIAVHSTTGDMRQLGGFESHSAAADVMGFLCENAIPMTRFVLYKFVLYPGDGSQFMIEVVESITAY